MVHKLNGFLVDPLANNYIVYHFSHFPLCCLHQAQIRNDPSFNSVCQTNMVKVEKPLWKNKRGRFPSTKQSCQLLLHRHKKDPDKRCPDKKPHTLKSVETEGSSGRIVTVLGVASPQCTLQGSVKASLSALSTTVTNTNLLCTQVRHRGLRL